MNPRKTHPALRILLILSMIFFGSAKPVQATPTLPYPQEVVILGEQATLINIMLASSGSLALIQSAPINSPLSSSCQVGSNNLTIAVLAVLSAPPGSPPQSDNVPATLAWLSQYFSEVKTEPNYDIWGNSIGNSVGGSSGSIIKLMKSQPASKPSYLGGSNSITVLFDTWPYPTSNGPVTYNYWTLNKVYSPITVLSPTYTPGLPPIGTPVLNAAFHGPIMQSIIANLAPYIQRVIVPVLNNYAQGNIFSLATGMDVALQYLQNSGNLNNANFSMSLGYGAGTYKSDVIRCLLDTAYHNGIVTAAATGNVGNATLPDYPAAFGTDWPGVIAVGASNLAGTPDWYANLPDLVATPKANYIMAPVGDDKASTDINALVDYCVNNNSYADCGYGSIDNGQNYGVFHGTSGAAPQVAAIAALLKARGISASQIAPCLVNTATNRVLNIKAALNCR